MIPAIPSRAMGPPISQRPASMNIEIDFRMWVMLSGFENHFYF
jgi:hypothetical protein